MAGQGKVQLLAGAALFALASEHENFGNAALEALATGTPVLLSPHVDLAQQAVAAGLGRTAPLEVEAWRDHLATMLEITTVKDRFVGRARDWVAGSFTWKSVADGLTEHYRRIVAEGV